MANKNWSKFTPKKVDNSHIIKANVKHDWSEHQKNIFKNISRETGHLIVEAYAGSAKSTSIIEGFKYVPKNMKSIVLAFNRLIKEELQARAPSYIEKFTFHGFGLKAIKQRFGNDLKIDDNKVFDIVKKQLDDDHNYDLINNICDTVAFCKYSLQDTPNQIDEIINNFGIDLCEMDRKEFISLIIKTLGIDKTTMNVCVDFDDMCWAPFVYNLPLGQFDYVFVDECLPGPTPILLADGSSKTIEEIVNQKLSVNVLSYDPIAKTQKACKVIGYSKTPNQKPLVKIKAKWSQYKIINGNNRNKPTNFVVCTTDHNIWANNSWIEAGKIKPGMIVQIETLAQKSQFGKITAKGKNTLSGLMDQKNDNGQMEHDNHHGLISVRGGNGRGLTIPQEYILQFLNDDWKTEHAIPTKMGRLSGYPTCYKLDIANPTLKIGIEIDGETHNGKVGKERDIKKQSLLESFGWTILHFSNVDVMQRINECLSKIRCPDGINCPIDAVVLSVEPFVMEDYFVYDLAVEDCHNFYANGILVHNCQDLNKSQLVMAKKACKINGGRMIMVGDSFQCVDENTLIKTDNGDFLVKNIVLGNNVLSYENGKASYKKVLYKVRSNWDHGIKITTKSGKSLTMSPNHKIWAEQQSVDGKFLVYLMYRKDLGFRVGKTNKWKATSNPFGARALHEQADKLWVLDVVNTNEEAIFIEECYSLKYGIPTAVFSAAERGLNQDRIDKIFSIFGKNGVKCLEDKHYSFDLPHWMGRCMSVSNKSRLVVRISAQHKKQKSSVNFEISDNSVISILQQNGITGKTYSRRPTNLPHFSVRKWFHKYTDALMFAHKVANLTGAYITENLSFGKEDDLRLLTASSLFVGMNVIVHDKNLFSKDEIVSIEKVPGTFYDLEIEDTNNFVGNDVLSHNSLYSWRMADTSIMEEIRKLETTKILPLPISYRCPKEIIKLAKNWVPDITCPETAIEGEIKDISLNELYKLAKPGCFIISRTNAPMIKICFNLIRNGIRANIRGRDVGKQLNYLIKKSKKKQTVAFLKWLDNWKNEEVEKLQAKRINTENILDRVECLITLCEECKSLDEVSKKIDELFNDTDEKNIVILTSSHRSKGLERDDVFVLRWTFRTWFDQMHLIEKPNEEANIAYVAISRARKRLFIVHKSIV
jgi:hypothetical protein